MKSLSHITTKTMKESLFKVEDGLVENYNRALEAVIGKRTHLTQFYIDKRGESPEIEAELGKHYLQAGPAHRFCIVISPDQKDTDLIHEEFSFDNKIIDFLYENYLPGISISTRVDGLYGEINHNVRHYETLEDLLLIKKVHIELHTPSGFLTKGRELQKCVENLQKDPELLIKDDSALPKRILELVKEVGDVRNYNLSPIEATKEIRTFYTRLFDGVFIFTESQADNIIHVKRPGEKKKHKSKEVSYKKNYPQSVVIYNQNDYQPEDGPLVKFIPLQDKARVTDFLLVNHYARYSYELLEKRLSRLEDETLLQKGYDVVIMGKEAKIQALHVCHGEMLPEWYELRNLKVKLNKGYQLTSIANNYSPEIRSMLLRPIPYEKKDEYVVEHLLTKLFPNDYENMYVHNRQDLKKIWNTADKNKQKYIANVIR